MLETAKKELFERIIQIRPSLSPKKRRVADFMMADYKRLFLMSAKEIARRCEVSEPTVTRLVMDLGFAGYGEFEEYLKGLLRIELTSVERLIKTGAAGERHGTLAGFHRNTLANLEKMTASVGEADVRRLAERIQAADAVLVAGYKLSAVLALYFGYLLQKIRPGVRVDTTLAGENLDALALDGGRYLLLAIAFPRYPRTIVQLLDYARSYQVEIFGITDSPNSPVVERAGDYVIIDMEGHSFVDPFAHIVTFLGAVVHEVAYIDQPRTAERLARIEEGVRRRKDFYYQPQEEPYEPLKPKGRPPGGTP